MSIIASMVEMNDDKNGDRVALHSVGLRHRPRSRMPMLRGHEDDARVVC